MKGDTGCVREWWRMQGSGETGDNTGQERKGVGSVLHADAFTNRNAVSVIDG